MQSNGELKKLLHELQAQGNQTGTVKALELEVIELLQKVDDATQRALKSEEQMASIEETLRDYKELNDLLEADNAKFVSRPSMPHLSHNVCSANGRADQMIVRVSLSQRDRQC